MGINWLKAFFFLLGGTVAAAGAAYVTGALDVFLPERQTEVASLPAPQSAPMAPAAPEAAAPTVEQPAAPANEEAASPEVEPEIIVPAFDLVRVEPDGSLVIAGSAAPIANIEIVTGASTVGRGESNEVGDFAIVLNEPLKPGDYTIVLRSTTRDAIVATSTETAIVSVPDHPSGQVLALVEQPGAPSRLITVPEAATPKQDRPVAVEPQQTAEEVEQPQIAAEQPAVQRADEVKPAEPATETAAAPEPEQLEQEPAGQTAAAEQEPAVEEEQDLAGAPAQAAPEEPQQQQQIVAVAEPDSQPAQEQAAAPVDMPRIAVEAVEIEGRRVFVAGRAEAGARVRVYANDILLGDSQASDGGRFLVEAERDLPVGDYIVRADLLGRNAEVLARAAVPFEREPGEAVAAVAALQPQPVAPQPRSAAKPHTAAAESEPARPAETVAAGEARKPAEQAPSQTAVPVPRGGEELAEQQVASAPAAGSTVATDAVRPPADSATAEPEVTAPKLQSVAGAVIIRRGDTLWRISKRVYGRGVRYTTIYLANQDQIYDPDRIWPGQVFNVPGKTESGEAADMSAVADRIPEMQAETR